MNINYKYFKDTKRTLIDSLKILFNKSIKIHKFPFNNKKMVNI